MPAARATTTVGLVQINRALNLSRQRFKGKRQGAGWVRAKPAVPDAPDQWEMFPYSVGMLQAYAQAHAANPGDFTFLEILHVPLSVDDAVARLEGADIVGFSVYVWNIELSLAIARRLKELRPAVRVVFGGPQVPDRAEAFLRDNPTITSSVTAKANAPSWRCSNNRSLENRAGSPGRAISIPGGHSSISRRAPV